MRTTDQAGGAPLVSVGIPTYNRPEGLARTLRCITRQTYENLEIIVSDNGSNDARVADVLEEFQARDPRVQVFRQARNRGPYENYRFVLQHATGTYFMWAADDDSWEPEFVAQLVALLGRDAGVGLAFCAFDALDPAGQRIDIYPQFLPLIQRFSSPGGRERLTNYIAQEEAHGKANLIYGLFRRSILEAAGGVRGTGSWGEDMLIVGAVLALADFAVCERLLYHVGPHIPSESVKTRHTATPAEVAQKRSRRVMAAIARHAGYLYGYARIVISAPGISLGDRAALLGVIMRRFCALISRDIKSG